VLMQSQPIESKDIRCAEFEKFYTEILASPLDPQIKLDVHKNVQCWVYIAQNFDFIKNAVDDWKKYPVGEKSKAADQYYPYAQNRERDKKSGLLRTPENLSFHIKDYKDGANAVSALNNHLDQIASVLKRLSVEDRIIFGLMLEWNKQVGCMEARAERALGWASRKLSGMTPLLKDIMTEIGGLYNISSKEKPFIDFAEEYCRRRGYTQWIDDEQQLSDISKQLLYQQGVLACLIDEEKKEEKLSELAAAYKAHIQSATAIVLGFTGTMIQHHFADENEAKKFLDWAKEQKQLPSINKASIAKEIYKGKVSYVVRLNKKQLEIIDKEQLNRVMKPPQSAVIAAPKTASPAVVPDVKKPPVIIQSTPSSQRSDSEIKQLWGKLQTAIDAGDAKEITRLMTGVTHEEQVTLLEITDVCGANLLNRAAAIDDKNFVILFDLFLEDVRNKALCVRDYEGFSVAHTVAYSLLPDTFCHLVKNTDEKTLNSVLPLLAREGSSVLHFAAERQKGKPFRMLVEKVDARLFSETLSLLNGQRITVLHYAAENQPDDVFCLVVDKADAKAISKGLRLKNNSGNTALHLAARDRVGQPFRLLIEKADAKDLSQALPLQNKVKETPLHFAAMGQPDDVFCLLVKKVDTKAINQALPLQDKDDNTVLHLAAIYKRGDSFHLLIEKADAKIISEVLPLQSENKETVLHLAAWKQPADVFCRLIERADTKSIDQALCLQNSAQETVLHVAACYQSSDAFGYLIKRCSSEALSKACCLYKKGTSVLETALSYQSPSVIAELLNAIDDDALKAMFKAPNIPSRLLAAVAGCLGHDPSFQTQPLVGRLFALAGPQLAEYCTQLWLAGKSLPHTVIQAALPHFKKLIQMQAQRAAELEEIARIFSKEEKTASKQDVLLIRLKSGEALELKDKEKASETLWKQGLYSLYDYHLLKKHFPGSQLAQTADDLHYLDLLLQGCPLPFKPTEINPRLAQTNAKGEVLFKTIKPKDWSEFLKQMKNYNYRAELRNPNQDKSEAKDKYVHLEGKTLSELGKEYEVHKDKKKDPYEQTAKQSVSLLSENYDTAIFGEHDPDRQLVGLLFSREFSVIKAMLLKDLGTFYRKWVGSKKDVAEYAEAMKDINVTDFEKFKEEVAKNPQKLNEMLVKLSRKSMLGVVMATDTPLARRQARAYQKDIRDELQIDLPIYFYDRALRIMRLYTPREREDDFNLEKRLGLLQTAIIRDDAKEVAAFIEGVTEREKTKLLSGYVDDIGANLHMAAEKSKTSLIILFNFFSTILHVAAGYQLSDDFLALIERVDVKILNQSLGLKNHMGETVLHIAANKQPVEIFRLLLKKIDDETLLKLLPLKNMQDESAFLAIAMFQPGVILVEIIERYSKKGESILESILPHQSPGAIAKLLNAIDHDTLKKMFHAPNIPLRLFDAVASYIGHEPSFQTEPLISRLTELMGQKLVDYCTNLLLAGKPLPKAVIQAVFPSFKEFIKEEKLSKVPSNTQEFIELLEFYKMFEINKSPEPKKPWYQNLWKLGEVSREVNLSATVKMIALLKGEKKEFTEPEFDAFKRSNLGEIIADMRNKKLLPDEFARQEKIYAIRMRKS